MEISEDKIEFIKSESIRQFLKGELPNQALMKALKLGDTKTVNGKLFVVKMTPSGKLDWRISKKKVKNNKKSKSKKLKEIEDLFEVKDFPELDDLIEIKDLGGSTGAKLVEDTKSGKQFVMKKGNSKEHVEEEFLANSIYKLFDVRVPNMKLYKGKDESTILSEYMPNTVAANNMMDEQTRDDIAEHYVLDCLLANWDIYKNDNILIDTDEGELVRVDNGGALRFSAQGRPKGDNFSEEVEELDTMAQHNPFIAGELTDAKIKKQIKKILVKGDNIVHFIDDKDLKNTMYERLMDLKEYVTDTPKDPYRDLKERDLKRALRRAGKVTNTGPNGWSFLSEICKLRGFDEVPEVLSSKEFDKRLKKKGSILLNRGITASQGNTAKHYMKDFTEGEECFYGTRAMYGAGIYAAVNAQKQNPPPPNPDYDIALDYAQFKKEHVLDILIEDDAKIVDGDELDEMMNEEFFGEEFKEKKKEYDEAKDSFNEMKNKKERIEDEIEFNVKKDLGWNEKTLKILNRSNPEEVYADPNKFNRKKAVTFFTKVVESLNGKVTKIDKNTHEFKLPNSSSSFKLNEMQFKNSLKQKSENSTPYNWHYRNLKEFIKKEHFSKIKGKVELEKKNRYNTDKNLIKIQKELKVSENKIKVLANDIEKVKQSGSGTVNEVMAEIIKHPGGTHRGFYAAIKGYDAIISKRGWGTNTDFAVILNRSKVKVREFK